MNKIEKIKLALPIFELFKNGKMLHYETIYKTFSRSGG